MTESTAEDVAHMFAALALARRNLGQTWPNPSVGCVIVRDGRVAGRGATAPGGRPHAETEALGRAGPASRGATAYVSLEPCCHWGQTPPCTDALIAAGIARVVVGAPDPDQRVNGGGITALRAAGIPLTEAVLRAEAEEVIAGFLTRVRSGRPLVTLKLASTLDGRIATRSGESRWITGPAARRATHAMRGRHDAVMVGVGTVLADDPELTCRLPGFRARPVVRVVADSRLRTPDSARLFRDRGTPVWLLADSVDPSRRRALEAKGAKIIIPSPPTVAGGERPTPPRLDLSAALAALGAQGLTSVFVEGGATLAASLLRADLVDRIAWFHAPALMGGDGIPAVAGIGLDHLADLPRFRRRSAIPLGDDMLTELERAV